MCLLPSPLAGPSVWQLAAAALRTLGWDVAEGTRSANPPDTTQDVLAWFLAAIPGDQDVLLVPHSNAGLYVPMLTAYRSVTGYIFVDAGLPGPAGLVPTLPVEMYDFVAGMAADQVRGLVAAGRDEAAGALIPDEVLDRFAFSGTPEHVATLAQRVLDAGAGRIDFGTPHGLVDQAGVALLGTAVLPLLQR